MRPQSCCSSPQPLALRAATWLLPTPHQALVAWQAGAWADPAHVGAAALPRLRLFSRMPTGKGLIPPRGRTWGRRMLSSSEIPVPTVPSVWTPGEEREGGGSGHQTDVEEGGDGGMRGWLQPGPHKGPNPACFRKKRVS